MRRATLDDLTLQRSVLLRTNSVLLYIYAFWCDDLIKARVVHGQVKPSYDLTAWKSNFALLALIRSEGRGDALRPIRALVDLLEGVIRSANARQIRREAHFRAERALHISQHANGTSAAGGPSPASTGSPESLAASADTVGALNQMLAASGDHETAVKLIRAALSDRDAVFAPANLPVYLPRTAAKAAANARRADQDTQPTFDVAAPWAWPVDVLHGPFAIAHVACFGLSVVDELAEQLGLAGFAAVGLGDIEA